jgi:hypothetical protein
MSKPFMAAIDEPGHAKVLGERSCRKLHYVNILQNVNVGTLGLWLLAPGKAESFDVSAGRLISRRLGQGSRLLVQLSLVKSPFAEINYGSGTDVALETTADAGAPLRVDWSTASFLDLPISP